MYYESLRISAGGAIDRMLGKIEGDENHYLLKDLIRLVFGVDRPQKAST